MYTHGVVTFELMNSTGDRLFVTLSIPLCYRAVSEGDGLIQTGNVCQGVSTL